MSIVHFLLWFGVLPAAQLGDDRVTPPGGQVSDTTARAADRAVDQVQRQHPAAPAAVSPQVTRETRRATGTPQLSDGTRSARGSEALSRRSDGRQTGVVRVGGRDRCDPAGPVAGTAACDRVIETRSAEFARPAPAALSPEQRLLLDRERGEASGVRSAIQRVGRNDIDSDALDTQTLAALTLGKTAADTPAPTSEDAPAETAIDAVIQIINAAQAAAPK